MSKRTTVQQSMPAPPLLDQTAGNITKDGSNTVINGIKLSSMCYDSFLYVSSKKLDEPDSQKIVTVVANQGKTGETMELSYTNYKVIGNGSFGVVFQAKLLDNGDAAAIKKVLQDKRFKVGFMAPQPFVIYGDRIVNYK